MGILEHTQKALAVNVEMSRALMELKAKLGSASFYPADLIPDVEKISELQREIAQHLTNLE